MKSRSPTVLIVAAALAFALGVGACTSASSSSSGSGSGAPISLLTVGLPFSITTLDATNDQTGRRAANLGLETLMTMTPNGQAGPWLAQSVTQPSSTVYVYHLRHGVKFWDGDELTADDVAYSLDYERRPASQVAFTYNNVMSITAAGRYTVVVTLNHPDPSWKFDVATDATLIFEKKFQQEHKSTFGQPGTLVMGTGPWEIKSLDPTTGMGLSANPHWWGGKVNIQHISVKFFSSENSMSLAFRAGEIDFVGFSIGQARAFAATANTALLTSATCQVTFFSMNVHAPPWSDIHVRRAVAYATDRSDLVTAHGGYATPVPTIIVPLMLNELYSPSQTTALFRSLPQYPHSLSQARQEMAKSAYPHGFSYSLDEPDIVNLPTVAEALAGELKPLGINLTVNVVSVAKWTEEISGPAARRPANVWAAGCVGPDPSGLDALLGSKNTELGQYNTADYAPSAMDTLIAQGETTIDPASRRVIYQKLLTSLADDLPYIPFFVQQNAFAISGGFSWQANPYTDYNGTYMLSVRPK